LIEKICIPIVLIDPIRCSQYTAWNGKGPDDIKDQPG